MPGVGVGIIILNELKQVLLILRNSAPEKALSDMHLEGTWTLPAGKVKLNETMMEAAKRKAKSEVNLDVSNLDIVSIEDDINEYAHFVTISFLVHEYNGKINLGDTEEHVDYSFFDLNDLPENLCKPSKKILNNYINKRIYKED